MSLDTDRQSPLFVGSVEKAMTVLLAFEGKSDLRLMEVVEETGLGKSAVQRFLFTFRALGFLIQDPVRKSYALTPKVLRLAYGFSRSDALIRASLPHLEALRNEIGESVNLSRLAEDSRQMIIIARVAGRHRLDDNISIGERYDAYRSSTGTAILATMTDDLLDPLIDSMHYVQLTPNTVGSPAQMRRRIAETRANGYALLVEETVIGSIAGAAAVLDRNRRAVGAVSISAPIARWPKPSFVETVVPRIVETAQAISREML